MSQPRQTLLRCRQLQREFEAELEGAAERMQGRLLRGQAGRFPARRLASHLRRQGFLPSRHFLERLQQRAQAQGIRFDPRVFGNEFRNAQHYRQTRPNLNTRIAMVRGLPVVYRMGGENANRVVLVTLLPEGALPPVEPVASPRLREREEFARPRVRPHPRPAWAVNASCTTYLDRCLANSRQRRGSVFGESRCQSCWKRCSGSGRWPNHLRDVGRCDFWRY